MSRHRAVRNLDLDEELAEDDYYDEDPYGKASTLYYRCASNWTSIELTRLASCIALLENLSAEDHDAMTEAYNQTLDVLGPLSSNGFTEREIKDILWDAYFDVDSAVTQLVEEKSRREAKAERDRQKQGKFSRTEVTDSSVSSLPPNSVFLITSRGVRERCTEKSCAREGGRKGRPSTGG